MKKAIITTAEYIEEMRESARKLEMKCDIASDFHNAILEKYKYNYMLVEMNEEGNFKKDENGDYIYREKRDDDWQYEEAMIAKEVVKAIEKALECYCFID